MSTDFNEHDNGLKVETTTFEDVPVEERRHVTDDVLDVEDAELRPLNDTPQHIITLSVIFWLVQVMGEILFVVGMGVVEKRWVMYFMPFLWAYVVSAYLLVHSVSSAEPRVNALSVAIYIFQIILGFIFVVVYASRIHTNCSKSKDDQWCQGYLTAEFGWIVKFICLVYQGFLIRREYRIRNASKIKFTKSIYARGLRLAIWISIALYSIIMIISYPIAYGSNNGGSFFFSLALFLMFAVSCLLGIEKPTEERHRALTIFHSVLGMAGLISYYIGVVYLQQKWD